MSACLQDVRDPQLVAAGRIATAALHSAQSWLAQSNDAASLQASARRLAMTLGRSAQLALLIEHAHWQLSEANDRSGVAAALRFAGERIDELNAHSTSGENLLAD